MGITVKIRRSRRQAVEGPVGVLDREPNGMLVVHRRLRLYSGQRVLNGFRRDVRSDVLDRACGRRIPVELQRRVDVGQRSADGVAAADQDDGAKSAAPRVTRWAVPTILTPSRLTLCAPAQYSPGSSPTCGSRPSEVSAATIRAVPASKRSWIPATMSSARRDLLEDDRALVVDHRVAAALAQHRLEAVPPRRLLARPRIPGAALSAKGCGRARPVHVRAAGRAPAGDLAEQLAAFTSSRARASCSAGR